MTQKLAHIANTRGAIAKIEAEGNHSCNHRRVHVNITIGHLHATVNLYGATRQPNVYVLSWYVEPRSERHLSADFAIIAHASINQYHRQKATTVAHSFSDLCSAIESGLHCVAEGIAFEAEESNAQRKHFLDVPIA